MRKKLLAGIGAAGLLVLALSPAAHAADQTVIDTPPDGLIAVDLSSPTGVDEITRQFEVTATGLVTKVTVTVDFMASRSDACTSEFNWDTTYADELSLTLISPALTEIPLVYTWNGDQDATYDHEYSADEEVVPTRVQVTFDDAAANMVGLVNDGYPITGVFQPVSPLSAVNGETAAGTWSLRIFDEDPGAAQCYYSATLNVVTDGENAPVAPTAPAKVETAAQ